METPTHEHTGVEVHLTFSDSAETEMLTLMEQTGKPMNTLAIEGLVLRLRQQEALEEGWQLAAVQEYTDGSFEVEELIPEFDDEESATQEVAGPPMATVLPFPERHPER